MNNVIHVDIFSQNKYKNKPEQENVGENIIHVDDFLHEGKKRKEENERKKIIEEIIEEAKELF